MAYEYEGKLIDYASGSKTYEEYKAMSQELQEVYRKAKAMDEIEQAYWKSNTPENFAYEFVGIFEKHFNNGVERANDER
ncbi:hypothetical protein [Staphylococcus saprophyticus]|uniref:hypothetical protein n=1 Tax=Staphylococcus saprophyticus TaxID=29385 RepID=UPI0022EA1074|nr:hypothetical protein [Staphylococcus saprophyticus]